jgi:putative membrane protein
MRKLQLFFITFVFCFSLAYAQGSNKKYNDRLTGRDSAFVKEAESGGMMEVTLGRIAEKNASSKAVKKFGGRMVKDHSTANDQLEKLAKKNHLPVINKMNSEDQSTVDNLKAVSGKKFDTRYMANMVGDHEADIQSFENASQNVLKKDLKDWINKTLPILKEHLKLAKKTYSEIKE